MNTREQAIAYISGAIATYSLRKERGELEDQASMYDFLAKPFLMNWNLKQELN